MKDLYKEEDIEAAVKELQEMEDAEWRALIAGMFYQPPQRTAKNRKKKRNLYKAR